MYKITNTVNNKIYIGVHKTSNINDGYMGSGKLIKRAIEKYGRHCFKKEILQFFDSYKDALEYEKEIVNDQFLLREDIYNLRAGGSGGFDYINKNQLCSIRPFTNNSVQRKCIESRKKRILKNGYSKKELERFKTKSNSMKGHTWWVGRTHSDETKQKMSQSKKVTSAGDKNSQYGTMWIYNELTFESKKVHNTTIVPVGWLKGRKIKKDL